MRGMARLRLLPLLSGRVWRWPTISTAGHPWPQREILNVGGSYAVTLAFVLRAGVYHTDRRNSANDATSYALKGVYSLSKRTDLFLSASYMDNKAGSNFGVVSGTVVAPGVGQTGVVAGVKHIF